MWHADPYNYFSRHGTNATENASEMYNLLYTVYGWDIYAVCAILANTYAESTFNPWLWEHLSGYSNPRSTADYQSWPGGYGLIQWTPYPSTPYPNVQPYIDSSVAQGYTFYSPNFADQAGSPMDGDAQTRFIVYDMMAVGNWFPANQSYYGPAFTAIGVDINTFRNMAKTSFASGTGTPYTPEAYVGAFALNYLRPNNTAAANRFWDSVDEFDYWYQHFTGQPPPPQPPHISIYQMHYIHKHKKGGFIYGI